MCDGYQLSNIVVVALATSILQNMEMFTDEDKLHVIDFSKLKIEKGVLQ